MESGRWKVEGGRWIVDMAIELTKLEVHGSCAAGRAWTPKLGGRKAVPPLMIKGARWTTRGGIGSMGQSPGGASGVCTLSG